MQENENQVDRFVKEYARLLGFLVNRRDAETIRDLLELFNKTCSLSLHSIQEGQQLADRAMLN